MAAVFFKRDQLKLVADHLRGFSMPGDELKYRELRASLDVAKRIEYVREVVNMIDLLMELPISDDSKGFKLEDL